jgi:Tfp pilus assembly protein PilN
MLTKRNSRLRRQSNHSNLAHCVAVGYGKMLFINSSARGEWVSEGLAWLLPTHEPLRDLSTRKWTEIAVDNDHMRLIRDSDLGKALPTLGNEQVIAGNTPLTGVLRPAERVVLSFNSDLCLELDETLPNVSATKTEAILGFSNIRTLPMAKTDYVWGWFQQGQSEIQQHCKKVILRKDILNSALAAIATAGATCRGIIFRPAGKSPYPIALRPDGSSYNRDRFSLWARGFAWAFFVLAAAVTAFVTTAALRQRQQIAAIASASDTLAVEVKTFREKLSAETQSQQVIAQLASRKSSGTKLSSLLNALSIALPDSAFVTSLRVEGTTATFDGLASDPEGLVSTLESSPLFVDVTFAGPVVHNPGEDKSRFSLRMKIEPTTLKPNP